MKTPNILPLLLEFLDKTKIKQGFVRGRTKKQNLITRKLKKRKISTRKTTKNKSFGVNEVKKPYACIQNIQNLANFWILDFGYWMRQNTGYWIVLDIGLDIHDTPGVDEHYFSLPTNFFLFFFLILASNLRNHLTEQNIDITPLLMQP